MGYHHSKLGNIEIIYTLLVLNFRLSGEIETSIFIGPLGNGRESPRSGSQHDRRDDGWSPYTEL